LLAFYEALAAEHRAVIAERATGRLAEAARILESRHVQGETSGYERVRVELEAEVARSELRVARAEAQTQRAELALLLGLSFRTLELRGSFATDPRAPTTAAGVPVSPPAGRRPQSRPERRSVRLTRSAARQAIAAGDSAASAWIPNVSLSGGLRIRQTDETQYGYVAGVAVSLPLFAHGQDVRAEAKAVASLLDAQAAAAERDAGLEALRAEQDVRSMRSELATFAEQTSERLERMLRGAESGYREGERTILELLDAQRTQTEIDRRRLDLELAAKRAEISLRAARGEFE
jgi:cobalt-zinc-cadmium efflux system outer membrane protein